MYELKNSGDQPAYLLLNTNRGKVSVDKNTIKGYQELDNNVKVYLYMESDRMPAETMTVGEGSVDTAVKDAEGRNACVGMRFNSGDSVINIRYGISLHPQAIGLLRHSQI